jgi:hypothetical protein
MTNTKSYKEKFSLSDRIKESNRIIAKHPTHVPVIVDIDQKFGTIKRNMIRLGNNKHVSCVLKLEMFIIINLKLLES